MDYKVITMGSCTLDCIIQIKDVLRFELLRDEEVKKYTAIEYSSKLNIEDVRFIPGGSAANIASDCSMMGIKSAYLGILGDDFSAKMCLEDLKNRGVDTSYIQLTDKDNTAYSVILKAGWGKDRSILAYKGANNLISPSDIKEELFDNIKAFAWTSLTKENSCKAIEKAIDLTKSQNATVFAAPSMSIIKNNPEWAEKLVSKSDILSLNREEASALLGMSDDASIIKEFIDRGLHLVSITNGKNGSILSDGKSIINNAVYETTVKDTTGAGDAFMSGLIVSSLENYSLKKTAQFCSALSSFEARELGVREGLPKSREVIEQFMKENKLKQVFSELS